MTKPIYVLNGPNLNRLGKREPQIYGSTTLAEVEAMCREAAGSHSIEFRQSNAEHQIVDWIHEAIDSGSGIIINPAGLTFRSIPIYDALKMADLQVDTDLRRSENVPRPDHRAAYFERASTRGDLPPVAHV
jgi:3-dehydroquinate dehydratase